MRFECTEALVDQILFSMEDQEENHFLDTLEGIVIGETELEELNERDAERFLLIPDWSSSDGFRLMERFAAGLRNPIVREELSSALDRGKGVFRAFKDVLSRHPEVERLWFSYKEKEMRRRIFEWYNALREEWGLDRLGEEPEETADLILEDFKFRTGNTGDMDKARRLHNCCVQEFIVGQFGSIVVGTEESLWDGRKQDWIFPGDFTVVAETNRSDFAGYCVVQKQFDSFRLIALEVSPEYRGLGIGEALLTRLLEQLYTQQGAYILLDLPTISEGFSRVLSRTGFKPYETRYCMKLRELKEYSY